MESTWETRDLPVLRAIVVLDEEDGNVVVEAQDVVDRTGFDEKAVQSALWALNGETPEPFFTILDASTMGGRYAGGVRGITGHARRTVGAWPTAEGLADRLTAALERAAENEPDPETKGKLRRFAEGTGGVARDVLVEVLASVLTKGA